MDETNQSAPSPAADYAGDGLREIVESLAQSTTDLVSAISLLVSTMQLSSTMQQGDSGGDER